MESKQSTSTNRSSSTSTDDTPVVNKRVFKTSRDGGGHGFTNPSNTQYFKKLDRDFIRVTKKEFYGDSSISSSDIYGCVYGKDGKPYTKQQLLDRNLQKQLDPIKPEFVLECLLPPKEQLEVANKLVFLIQDDVGKHQCDRILVLLDDFYKYSSDGYTVNVLPSLCVILDFLIENSPKICDFDKSIDKLIENIKKPILMELASEVVKRFDYLRDYMGYLGYLLMRIEEDKRFDVLARNIIWLLSAPKSCRGRTGVSPRHTLAAATPALHEVVARMLAVCRPSRYKAFIEIALILALDSEYSCLKLISENVLENICYRFNPYFPDRMLPDFDTGPADPQDIELKLGSSSLDLLNVINLLLVLLKSLRKYISTDPSVVESLPCPGLNSLRCLIWAFRYECRAREHKSERLTMTVVAHSLLECFGSKLEAFSFLLMADVMSLSVATEVNPPEESWLRTVSMNTMQIDTQFKKELIYLSVTLLHTFPSNVFMVESQYWLVGLMYLLDPDLCRLRVKWSTALFDELRNVSLQALVCTLHLIPHRMVRDTELIRRILWYVEWYSVSPFDLNVLYWCLRILKEALHSKNQLKERNESIQDLFDTHGINILIYLSYTLMAQKKPPLEKVQVILGLILRMITSGVVYNDRVVCAVYPDIHWPKAINRLAKSMLDMVWSSLSSAYYLSGRWIVSLLNFVWEGIIWKDKYREIFIVSGGVFKLLDLVTMLKPPVQGMALALVCDIARAGEAVAQLLTWRAGISAMTLDPPVVARGASIASLLAHIFRDECQAIGAQIDLDGVVLDMDNPLMANEIRQLMSKETCFRDESSRAPACYTAGDLAASRLSKVFSLLHLLNDDLDQKVSVADVTYNMYKNVKLKEADEVTLVLCSHYLTLKQCEVWHELNYQCWNYLNIDEHMVKEFLDLGRGWVRIIQKQQREAIEMRRKAESVEEQSLFEFLGRARLNIALDALVEVRRAERATDRAHLLHAQLNDMAHAHVRRDALTKRLHVPIIRTYMPQLDELNPIGQTIKVKSITKTYGRGRKRADSAMRRRMSYQSEGGGGAAGDH